MQVSPSNASGLLRCTSCAARGGLGRRLVLPRARFAVGKLEARHGSFADGALEDTVRNRSSDAVGGPKTEFAVRWSLEHLLNSLFLPMLAVESVEHLPSPVARGSSLPFVRHLHNIAQVPVDSENYGTQLGEGAKEQALMRAAQEAVHGPRSRCVECTEELRKTDSNQLLRLLHVVRQQIELAAHFCLVCHQPVEVLGVKPFVCDNPLCIHQFEDLSLGANPDLEVERNPEVVDLLISLCFHHVTKAPALENMPSWDMFRRCYRRGEGTLEAVHTRFPGSVICQKRLCLSERDDVSHLNIKQGAILRIRSRLGLQQERVVTKVEPGDSWFEIEEPFTFDLDLVESFAVCTSQTNEDKWDIGFEIADIIDRLPPVKDMQEWVAAGHKIKSKLDEIDGRLFPAVRWILCTFRGHLRYVDGSKPEDCIPELHAQGFRQFVMTCTSASREAAFQTHARTFPVRNAFHGSPIANWHSILRNGLTFDKVAHGRSYGNGIYLALDINYSLQYTYSARAAPCGQRAARRGAYVEGSETWVGGKSIFDSTLAAVSVVDVIYRPQDFVSTSPHWVVPEIEWVVTRYLCVKDNTHGQAPVRLPASTLTVPGFVSLSTSAKNGRVAVEAGDQHSGRLPSGGGLKASTFNELGRVGGEGQGNEQGNGEQFERLCLMFSNIEPTTVSSVLRSASGDLEKAVHLLSARSAGPPSISAKLAGKRPIPDTATLRASTSASPRKHPSTEARCRSERARGKELQQDAPDVIDLTHDSDEDAEPAAAREGGSSTGGTVAEPPPESAIAEMLTVLEGLDRHEAVALLQRNRNNAQDAIISALATRC